MQRHVNFRDRQELQSADLSNVQLFTREAFDALIADAVGPGLYFTGFECQQTNTWELTVAAGRRYSEGQVFRRASDTVFDLFNLRPLSQKKMVAIVSWGQTIETDVQPRDMLIDVETGQTEPQSVAMESLRSAEVQTIAGTEAAQPQAPQIPASNVLIALVTLGTGGIETVQLQEDNRLPQIARNLIEILDMIRWRAETGTTIDRLKTDLYTLASAQKGYTPLSEFADLRNQLAAVRSLAESAHARATAHQLELVDTFQSDQHSDAGAAGYSALIDAGLRFAIEAAEQAGGLALLNPNDPKVTVVDGLMTPVASPKTAIDNSAGFSGAAALLGYTTTTQTLKTRTATEQVMVWDTSDQFKAYQKTLPGDSYTVGELRTFSPETMVRNGETYHRRTWSWDPATGAYSATYARKRAKTEQARQSYYDSVQTQVTAQGRAQTFVASSGGRLRDISLFFETVDDSGDVTVLISRADGNNPNQADVVAQTTIAAANLTTSGPVVAALPGITLEAGVRYSVHVLSQGNHKLRLSNQPRSITQGEHFAYVGDNKYIRPTGEADRDIALKINYQAYSSTKVEVDLQGISMAGGMDGVTIDGFVDEPEGTDVYFEVQIGGEWQTLDISEGQKVVADFSTRPNLVPLRVVMEGTLDKMPAIHIGGDKTTVTAMRREAALKWVSQPVELGAGNTTSSVKLTAALVGFEVDDMLCDLSLIVGGAPVAPTSVSDVTLETGEINRTAVFELGAPTQTYTAVIEGASDTATRFFVERLSHYVGA